jgi:hypothetical protein
MKTNQTENVFVFETHFYEALMTHEKRRDKEEESKECMERYVFRDDRLLTKYHYLVMPTNSG